MLGLYLEEYRTPTWQEVLDAGVGDIEGSHRCDNAPCVVFLHFCAEPSHDNINRRQELQFGRRDFCKHELKCLREYNWYKKEWTENAREMLQECLDQVVALPGRPILRNKKTMRIIGRDRISSLPEWVESARDLLEDDEDEC